MPEFYYIHLAFILLIFYCRISFVDKITPDGVEGFSMLCAATRKSLCPEGNDARGRLYYPLGFFWLALNLALKKDWLNNESIVFPNFDSSLINLSIRPRISLNSKPSCFSIFNVFSLCWVSCDC